MKKYLHSVFTLLFLSSSTLIFSQSQTFTSAGISNFTVPAGVIALKVQCVGGGGAGGRVTPSNPFDNDASGGGGGGAYASALVTVTAGNTYSLTVGAGGTNNGTSVDGGSSFFDNGTIILAEGGKTRSGNDNTAGADGGKAVNSVGTIKYDGGNGGNANEGDSDGGGGGGAAGSLGTGHNGGTVTGGPGQALYGDMVDPVVMTVLMDNQAAHTVEEEVDPVQMEVTIVMVDPGLLVLWW